MAALLNEATWGEAFEIHDEDVPLIFNSLVYPGDTSRYELWKWSFELANAQGCALNGDAVQWAIAVSEGDYPFDTYAIAMPVIVGPWVFTCWLFGIYRPARINLL